MLQVTVSFSNQNFGNILIQNLILLIINLVNDIGKWFGNSDEMFYKPIWQSCSEIVCICVDMNMKEVFCEYYFILPMSYFDAASPNWHKQNMWAGLNCEKDFINASNTSMKFVLINPFSTGTGWTLYKVYGGFRISYGTG